MWDNYSRTRHRYKLDRIFVETYLLSFCDGYIDIDTNPREIAHGLNLNKNQKDIQLTMALMKVGVF